MQLPTYTELVDVLNRRRLKMVYQPQLNTATNRIGGIEALVRWIRPDGSFVPPDVFVPLIEQYDLAETLTNVVVALVVDDYRLIAAHGYNVPMSINISASDLRKGNFIPKFLQAVDTNKVDPTCFGFEITETAIVDDYETSTRNIALLKSLGCKVSIDDFGTGNASCKYIHNFPLDEIKVDRFFITDLTTNNVSRTITQFMIELSHQLGGQAVAEGVENQETADILTSLHCDLIQGYWYSKPITIFDLIGFLHDNS